MIGGTRNWDYRYTWLRDAAFTVYAFLRIGFRAEAAAFMNWIETYPTKHIDPKAPMPILFTIQGDSSIPEQTLEHWEGYRGSGPVRVGNAAASQFQLDVYGELMDSLYLHNKYVSPISYDMWVKVRARMEWLCENGSRPDAGIWEMRNRQEHFVYSKVMNWVALDRAIPAGGQTRVAGRSREVAQRAGSHLRRSDDPRLEREAARLYPVLRERGSGCLTADHAAGFFHGSDRMLSTIAAILENPRRGGLVSDSLVYRYPPHPRIDGLPGEEGTFNMCSFWLVEALTRAGQRIPEKLDQARLIFERMLGYANHLGLYAEQTGPQGEALGNFPQAFTHLALISAAFNLDRILGSQN